MRPPLLRRQQAADQPLSPGRPPRQHRESRPSIPNPESDYHGENLDSESGQKVNCHDNRHHQLIHCPSLEITAPSGYSSSVRLTLGAHPRQLRRASDAGGVGCSAMLGTAPIEVRKCS
jgi:hypothetical protein